MADQSGVPDRLDRLERGQADLVRQVQAATADASAARVLASGPDRDVADARAHWNSVLPVLNALRQTQREQGEVLAAHSRRFDGLEQRMTDGFATVGAGMAEIVRLLGQAIGHGPG